MDYGGLIRADGRHISTLWYARVPLGRLLADVDVMAGALLGDAVLRVYTDLQEAQTAIPALCAARGYTLLPYEPREEREGDRRPYGRYHCDIGGRQHIHNFRQSFPDAVARWLRQWLQWERDR